MPRITFVDVEGAERVVDAEVGRSLMEAARLNGVPGILAMCCGFCVCATCHVHVDEVLLARLPPPGAKEAALLARVDHRRPESRLACQLRVDADFEGLRVRTPPSQG
jgi:2Fe-2S ferredoxin